MARKAVVFAACSISFCLIYYFLYGYVSDESRNDEELYLPTTLILEDIASLGGYDFYEPTSDILLVGDICFGLGIPQSIQMEKISYESLFSSVRGVIENADLALANLEGPVTTATEKGSYKSKVLGPRFVFLANPPNTVQALQQVGFDAVTIANNHLIDAGDIGVSDTVRYLSAAGMPFTGHINQTLTFPQPVVLTTKQGLRVGFLGLCDSCNTGSAGASRNQYLSGASHPADIRIFDPAVISKGIQQLKNDVDVVVVGFHHGVEFVWEQNSRQMEQSRFLIDSGADIVMGHHPHVGQGFEFYKDKLIIYSLGNFLFDDPVYALQIMSKKRDGRMHFNQQVWRVRVGVGGHIKLAEEARVQTCVYGVHATEDSTTSRRGGSVAASSKDFPDECLSMPFFVTPFHAHSPVEESGTGKGHLNFYKMAADPEGVLRRVD
eukprot:Rmarinus@m.22209